MSSKVTGGLERPLLTGGDGRLAADVEGPVDAGRNGTKGIDMRERWELVSPPVELERASAGACDARFECCWPASSVHASLPLPD